MRRTLHQLGLLQIDFVNVLVPAHYLPLFSRLGPYPRRLLDDLVYRRREFTEQWAHERAVIPVETWPLFEHRRQAHRLRPWGFETYVAGNPGYLARVLSEVRRQGALTANDLPDPPAVRRLNASAEPPRLADRWDWGRTVKTQVLEAHFGFGRLAVAERRPNFSRAYDLTERVIPGAGRARRLDRAEQQRGLIRQAARALGIGAAADLADYFRMRASEARPRLAELVEAGELREVRVEGWREPAYLDPGARLPRRIEARALLAPFDPLVFFRPRVARLFDFDYRLEIYLPRPRRRWGYYVLPFLLGERLVARVDLAADRQARCLRVLSAYFERDVEPGTVTAELTAELHALAGWLDLESVSAPPRGGLPSDISLRGR